LIAASNDLKQRFGFGVSSGWWLVVGVAGVPVGGLLALVVVLWHRHRRAMKQHLVPPFRPKDEHTIRWDNTRRRELDADATTRLAPIPEVAKGDPDSKAAGPGAALGNRRRTDGGRRSRPRKGRK
jgi:hypothetical protein